MQQDRMQLVQYKLRRICEGYKLTGINIVNPIEIHIVEDNAIRFINSRPIRLHLTWPNDINSEANVADRWRLASAHLPRGAGATALRGARLQAHTMQRIRLQTADCVRDVMWRVEHEQVVVIQTVPGYLT